MAVARWYFDPATDSWLYVQSLEPGVVGDTIHALEGYVVRQLLAALDEQGWIKPRLDDVIRQDDVKIIHRLIDVLEKSEAP